MVKVTQHFYHAFGEDPRLACVEEHSLDNRLVEDPDGLGVHARLDQGLAQPSPSCPGLHQVVEHCGPVVVVVGQWDGRGSGKVPPSLMRCHKP